MATKFDDFSSIGDAELIQQWEAVKRQVVETRKLESQLRDEVIRRSFGDLTENEGTLTRELGNGWSLKCTAKQSYTIKKDVIDSALHQLVNSGADGRFIAERLVTFEPKLSLSEYRKLDDRSRLIIDSALVIKPAAATLSLVEPKA